MNFPVTLVSPILLKSLIWVVIFGSQFFLLEHSKAA
jgi:hypothetical protein